MHSSFLSFIELPYRVSPRSRAPCEALVSVMNAEAIPILVHLPAECGRQPTDGHSDLSWQSGWEFLEKMQVSLPRTLPWGPGVFCLWWSSISLNSAGMAFSWILKPRVYSQRIWEGPNAGGRVQASGLAQGNDTQGETESDIKWQVGWLRKGTQRRWRVVWERRVCEKTLQVGGHMSLRHWVMAGVLKKGEEWVCRRRQEPGHMACWR